MYDIIETMKGGTAVDERDMIQKLKDRDQTGMDELLRRYGSMLRYIIGGVLTQHHEREECLNDVSLLVWEGIGSFDPAKGYFSVWLTVIARNAALNRLRSLQRREGKLAEMDPAMPDPAPGPEEQVLRKERAEHLRLAVAGLSAADQNLFYRKYYYLQSTEQMAAELGLTQRGVEGRLRRLRERLRKELGGEMP